MTEIGRVVDPPICTHSPLQPTHSLKLLYTVRGSNADRICEFEKGTDAGQPEAGVDGTGKRPAAKRAAETTLLPPFPLLHSIILIYDTH